MALLELCTWLAGGDANMGQMIIDNIQQGTAARISRVARMASRISRVTKAVASLNRMIIDFVLRHQNQLPRLAGLLGISDTAKREVEKRQKELAEKAREVREQRAREEGARRAAELAEDDVDDGADAASSPGIDSAPGLDGDGVGVHTPVKAGPKAADGHPTPSSSDKAVDPATGVGTHKEGGFARLGSLRKRASETLSFKRPPTQVLQSMKERKDAAAAKAVTNGNETAPSRIGTTIIEQFTSKVVFTLLLMLLIYSIFFDIPQINLRDNLYSKQLATLIQLARALGTTSSNAFVAVRSPSTKSGPRSTKSGPTAPRRVARSALPGATPACDEARSAVTALCPDGDPRPAGATPACDEARLPVMATRARQVLNVVIERGVNQTVNDRRLVDDFSDNAYAVYVKVDGVEVFNMSRALNLSYSIVGHRRRSELVYTRSSCQAIYQGVDVADEACESVIVYDRQKTLEDELRDQILVTVLMVLVITLCIGMMALDMQRMLLNPIDRITKLIKLVTGKRWRKKMRSRTEDEKASFSLTKLLEGVELETYFGLRTVNMFFMDVEQAFSINMGKYRQQLWALELWFDKLFFLINRAIDQALTRKLTVDELGGQVADFFRTETPAIFAKVSDWSTKNKKLAKVARLWGMVEQPRRWLYASLRDSLLSQVLSPRLAAPTPTCAHGVAVPAPCRAAPAPCLCDASRAARRPCRCASCSGRRRPSAQAS